MHRLSVSKYFEIGFAVLASIFATASLSRPAAAANNFYPVPIGYTWDHLSYDTNPGDYDVSLGDSGFDAGEIPGNTGSNTNGPAVTITNNDGLHGYSGIPFIIGPTQDGYNNVNMGEGQAVPVVPGKYKALYISYSAVNGPHHRAVVLNYSDGVAVVSEVWADWCAATQAPPDFFTWTAKHRNNATGQDNNSCSLITKYVPVNANRTLVGITLGFDAPAAPTTALEAGQLGGIADQGNGSAVGEVLPGDVISGGNGRTVIGAVTLISDDATLGGYGYVTGSVTNSDGSKIDTGTETGTSGSEVPGAEVAVVSPFIGNYGSAVQPDGTYKFGLPPGTYTLSAALRTPPDNLTSLGLQATPVSVTIEAGKTVTQNFKLLASPTPNLWGSISGVVNDSSGKTAAGQAILISSAQTGPFYAHGLTSQGVTIVGDTAGNFTDGAYEIDGLVAGDYWVEAASGSSQSDPVKVTVTGGKLTTVPTLVVKTLPIGSVTGSVTDPEGNFGGLGQNVQLKASDGTIFTASTIADPALSGTAILPIPATTAETAAFEIDNVPAGNYTVSLLTSAAQGKQDDQSISVSQGQTTTVSFKGTLPAFAEGTADATISDALKGATDKKWTVADIYETGMTDSAGNAISDSAKGTMTTDGKITTSLQYINGQSPSASTTAPDAFTYAYQVVPNEDLAISGDVIAAPQADPMAEVGLMIREDVDDSKEVTNSTGLQVTPHNALAADAFLAVTNGRGVVISGRTGTNLVTMPFGEFAVDTDPTASGTAPALPTSLKLRKVGASVAGFYSADGGKTEHFVGSFSPVFSTTTLRVGIALTSNVAATADAAQVQNFSFVNLTTATSTVKLGDLNSDGKINVSDATISLRIAVGLVTPTADQKTADDVNKDGKTTVADTTLILQVAVGVKSGF